MLSKRAKYAIKALISLAKQGGEIPMTTSQIYELEKIPKKSLEGVLLDLKKAGFIYSKKGMAGGYVLSKPASEILMLDIVRLTDGPIAQVSCASAFHYRRCEECLEEETCSIRNLYLEIRAADLKILSGTNLADMMAKENIIANIVLS